MTAPDPVREGYGEVRLGGSRGEARGLGSLDLVKGVPRGGMAVLARWSVESEKVFTF